MPVTVRAFSKDDLTRFSANRLSFTAVTLQNIQCFILSDTVDYLEKSILVKDVLNES